MCSGRDVNMFFLVCLYRLVGMFRATHKILWPRIIQFNVLIAKDTSGSIRSGVEWDGRVGRWGERGMAFRPGSSRILWRKRAQGHDCGVRTGQLGMPLGWPRGQLPLQCWFVSSLYHFRSRSEHASWQERILVLAKACRNPGCPVSAALCEGKQRAYL